MYRCIQLLLHFPCSFIDPSHSMQANAQIDNEDDAEKALQLSSALTQALLAYRIKKVSSSVSYVSCD